MTLYKTSILSAFETSLKLGCGFLIIKYLSLEIGPEGVAKFSQFQNFITIVLMSVTGVFSTGVVRYVSEYESSNIEQNRFIQAASFWSIFVSIIISILIAVFSTWLATTLLQREKYSFILYVFAFVLIFISYNQLIQAVLNGKGFSKLLITCRMYNSLMMLLLTVLLIYFFNLSGALISLAIVQAIVLPFTIVIVFKNNVCKIKEFIPIFHKKELKNISGYFIMSIISAAVIPVSMIVVRSYIVKSLGWEQAGFWDSAWKIAELYTLVITTGLSVYYLPVISKKMPIKELQAEVKKMMVFGVCFSIIFGFCVYIFRNFILYALFSPEFKPMLTLFPFMIIGSVIKIASWVYGYLMIAKAMVKMFIIGEILFAFVFIFSVIFGIKNYGLVGASISFSLSYFIYYTFTYFFVYKKICKSIIVG